MSDVFKEYMIKKFKKLVVKYNWVIYIEVFFKIENDVLGEKICEMELSFLGLKIFVVFKEKNFEMVVKEIILDL